MPDEDRLREQAREAVKNGKVDMSSGQPDGELRKRLRTQLATRQLFATTGISTVRLGTGRPCIVCNQPIAAAIMERQVEGPGVFGLAHPDCYLLWREESALLRKHPV